MRDENCIFCKIANGEIPSSTVYEDDDFRVILDLGPASKGHALILPKQHYKDICEADMAVTGKILPLAAKIGSAMKKGLGASGFNVVQNNGTSAGQTVFHLHVHGRNFKECAGRRVIYGGKMREYIKSQDECFYSIHSRYYPLLRTIAQRKGIPYDEIDDVLQDAFLAFYEHYPLTWPDSKIRATLIKTLKNLCIDYWRKRENRSVASMDPAELQVIRYELSILSGKDLSTVIVQKELYKDVMNALMTMKRDWAVVFFLYIIEGRPMDEVSRILGVSGAACRMRLMRGRKYLREKLEKTEENSLHEASGHLKKLPEASE